MKVWWFVYSQTSDYALTLQLFCTQPSQFRDDLFLCYLLSLLRHLIVETSAPAVQRSALLKFFYIFASFQGFHMEIKIIFFQNNIAKLRIQQTEVSGNQRHPNLRANGDVEIIDRKALTWRYSRQLGYKCPIAFQITLDNLRNNLLYMPALKESSVYSTKLFSAYRKLVIQQQYIVPGGSKSAAMHGLLCSFWYVRSSSSNLKSNPKPC